MNVKIPILALTPHGGARVLVAIANSMVEQGWDVTVVTSNYAASMPFTFDAKVKVKKVGWHSNNKALSLLGFLLLAPFYMVRSKIVANHFLTVLPSWIATVLFGSRYIYLVQGVEHRFFLRKLQWPLRTICKWTYRRGRMVAANTYLAAELSKFNPVLLTLNLGVSEAFFAPPPANETRKIHDVVYFLRRQPIKRVDRFDEMLPALAAKGFRVLGISQDTDMLREYSGRVAGCTPANDAELISAIDSAKILLLTSEHEGFALPPLEAMARGLPSVMYECGGPGVYATHGSNALIITDDRSSTAVEYVEKLITDEAMYRQMSDSAKNTAQKFRLDVAVAEFTRFLEKYFS
jgi:glycosyltransferase involved in cell wall biosynthesis